LSQPANGTAIPSITQRAKNRFIIESPYLYGGRRAAECLAPAFRTTQEDARLVAFIPWLWENKSDAPRIQRQFGR
jgi:hypothetical protein